MRQIVPINRFTCATNVRGCGYAKSALDGRFGGISLPFPWGAINLAPTPMPIEGGGSVKFIPTGAFGYSFETFAKGATGDTQAIDRTRVRFNQVVTAQLYRVNAEIMGYFIEMHLYSIAGLCGTMPAFRAARRLVSEKP